MRSLTAIESVDHSQISKIMEKRLKDLSSVSWQNGDKIIGTISGSHTLKAGGHAVGDIGERRLDPKEKTLSFDAKMSWQNLTRHGAVQRQMTDTELKGDLRLSDLACETPCTDVSGVASKEDVRLDQFDSEEAWKNTWNRNQGSRPKW